MRIEWVSIPTDSSIGVKYENTCKAHQVGKDLVRQAASFGPTASVGARKRANLYAMPEDTRQVLVARALRNGIGDREWQHQWQHKPRGNTARQ